MSGYAFSGSPYAQANSRYDTYGGGADNRGSTFNPRSGYHYRDDSRSQPLVPAQDRGAHRDDESPHGSVENEKRDAEDRNASYVAGYSAEKGIWRREDKRALARRNGPAKIFRAVGCVVYFTIVVIISIVCLVIIFARPPNVGISDVGVPTANDFSVSGTTFIIKSSVSFTVSNPNSISVTLQHLDAEVYDAVDTTTNIGSGSISNQKIPGGENSTIPFPYEIRIDPTKDQKVLADVTSKCGLTGGGSGGNLNLNLKVNAKLSVLGVAIPIPISRDISFACPFSASSLGNIPGLSQILQGLTNNISRRDIDSEGVRLDLAIINSMVQETFVRMAGKTPDAQSLDLRRVQSLAHSTL